MTVAFAQADLELLDQHNPPLMAAINHRLQWREQVKQRDLITKPVRKRKQIPPPGDWSIWLLLAGRGFGKSRSCVEEVFWQAATKPGSIWGVVAPTHDSLRRVCFFGKAGFAGIIPDICLARPINRSTLEIELWNGSKIIGYSSQEPERLRGPEFDGCYCLAGDTMVSMADGSQRRLDRVRAGDCVLTRFGSRRVLAARRTSEAAVVTRLRFLSGRAITGTADHPILVDGVGFVPLKKLKSGVAVCATRASCGAAEYGTGAQAGAVTTSRFSAFIERCGRLLTARSHQNITFITRTATRAIIAWKTWSCSQRRHTAPYILKRKSDLIEPERGQILKWLKPKFEQSWSSETLFAWFADRCSIVVAGTIPHFAPLNVCTVLPTITTNLSNGPACSVVLAIEQPNGSRNTAEERATTEHAPLGRSWKSKTWHAKPAASSSNLNASMLPIAPEPVLSRELVQDIKVLEDTQPVYNLLIDGAHEFIANGIVVHNCDELSSWKDLDSEDGPWSMLQFCMRSGQYGEPRILIATTPRPSRILKELLKRPDAYVVRGASAENRPNLAASWYQNLVGKYAGTRLGRQELEAELLEDVEGALWTTSMIHLVDDLPESAALISVGVDPSGSASGNEAGIVVCATNRQRDFGWVLADLSGRLSPDQWAARAVQCWRDYDADAIVVERNFGGEMCKAVIMKQVELAGIRNTPKIVEVTASRGKRIRAEPVAMLYERGQMRHLHGLSELEMEMTSWDATDGSPSPNRLDAMVWATTWLMLSERRDNFSTGRLLGM